MRYSACFVSGFRRAAAAAAILLPPAFPLLFCGCGRGAGGGEGAPADGPAGYIGSKSCRACHEEFYNRWAPSHHGLALQSYSPAFAAGLAPQTNDLTIGGAAYRFDAGAGAVVERIGGTNASYRITHVMGGKNVCYFLTPLERGKLQVLPLAWHAVKRIWFDTTGSMVRAFHASGDSALSWRDPMLTFNSACFNCHVSQLERNYDDKTDSYATIWREPGISCESCHGPSSRHAAFYKAHPDAGPDADKSIIRWRELPVRQVNDACAVCHAKLTPLTDEGLTPGESFWDHYDLATLEDADFSAVGRDRGENYTFTLWLMNPCAKAGKLSCVHCHTSSGRYRFAHAKTVKEANQSCASCHAGRAATPAALSAHTHHPPESPGSRCISCHMPMTSFASMRRSDHSQRPPDPATALRFGTRSACILCHDHKDRTDHWAAETVAKWRPKSAWRDKLMREGLLVDDARNGSADSVPAMLDYIRATNAEPVTVCALFRLLRNRGDRRILPAACAAAKSPDPLVATAAAESLEPFLNDGDARGALLAALNHPARVVRIRAVQALAAIPESAFPEGPIRESRSRAEKELLTALSLRRDTWQSWYDMGNYRMAQDRLPEALDAFDLAIRRRGDVVAPYVNASIAAARARQIARSVRYLQRAADIAPSNTAVHFNLGLALGETGDYPAAIRALKVAAGDPLLRDSAEKNIRAIRDFLENRTADGK